MESEILAKPQKEHREFARPIRATLLLGLPDNKVRNSSEYLAALPQIRALYGQAWRWHGTGRFQYAPPDYKEVRDVVEGVIQNNGLVPHRDPLDYTKGLMYSISTSPSRLYSSLYAQFHYEKGKKLRATAATAYGWAVFLRAIVEKDLRLMGKKFRIEHGLSKDDVLYFHSKYTRKPESVRRMIKGGLSDIPGNYPMLFGIKEGAFPEEDIAEVLKRHESRSTVPITFDKFTHIEVPLDHVEEIKQKLIASDLSIPVIPMEYGEEYSKSMPISWIVDGKPLDGK